MIRALLNKAYDKFNGSTKILSGAVFTGLTCEPTLMEFGDEYAMSEWNGIVILTKSREHKEKTISLKAGVVDVHLFPGFSNRWAIQTQDTIILFPIINDHDCTYLEYSLFNEENFDKRYPVKVIGETFECEPLINEIPGNLRLRDSRYTAPNGATIIVPQLSPMVIDNVMTLPSNLGYRTTIKSESNECCIRSYGYIITGTRSMLEDYIEKP